MCPSLQQYSAYAPYTLLSQRIGQERLADGESGSHDRPNLLNSHPPASSTSLLFKVAFAAVRRRPPHTSRPPGLLRIASLDES
ncbi:uncharacterized protein N7459_001936 [Penicillium hispanicum]|uniref:uncharacterized protein n=1 Tax=Penicillium hispanicum TaxID=1080232 RepID=UPI002541F1C5|nr:uncharacterized protein N7459_001936 [Penicillium hispanicum]KAJ5591567.1 hypothetical protein N7459_001936 [Penicillium hispanicum]